MLIIPKPLVVTHQTWYRRPNGSLHWQDRLKYFITRFATNISASQALAEYIPTAVKIIPNSYREDIFITCQTLLVTKSLFFRTLGF